MKKIKAALLGAGLTVTQLLCLCGCNGDNVSGADTQTSAATQDSVFVSKEVETEQEQTRLFLRFVSVENYGIVTNIWELSYAGETEPCYHFEYRHSSNILNAVDVNKERGDKIFDMFLKANTNYPTQEGIDRHTGSHFGYIDDDTRYSCSLAPDDYNAILEEMLAILQEEREKESTETANVVDEGQ